MFPEVVRRSPVSVPLCGFVEWCQIARQVQTYQRFTLFGIVSGSTSWVRSRPYCVLSNPSLNLRTSGPMLNEFIEPAHRAMGACLVLPPGHPNFAPSYLDSRSALRIDVRSGELHSCPLACRPVSIQGSRTTSPRCWLLISSNAVPVLLVFQQASVVVMALGPFDMLPTTPVRVLP